MRIILIIAGLVCCTVASRLSAATLSERMASLDAELELLLPGRDAQAQSTRAYAKQRLSAVCLALEAEKISKLKPHKAIVKLEAAVQAQFLLQYHPFANLDMLFKNGMYDPTTAAAVYALTMRFLELPHALQLQDGGVVLTAYPAELNHIVGGRKATDAQQHEAFQDAYMSVLMNVGFLPEQAWTQPKAELFVQYYTGGQRAINMQELAGFLYYQQALQAYKGKDWNAVLVQLQHARQLTDWPVYDVLKRAVWIQLATSPDLKSADSTTEYLWKLWGIAPGAPWQSALLAQFNTAIGTLPKPGIWPMDSLYLTYSERFAGHNDALLQLKAMYFLQRARFHAREGSTGKVMDYMDSLYLLRPTDTDVHDVLAGMLVWSLRTERSFAQGLELIAFYERKYPFLASNALFQDQHLFYQAERLRYYFDADDVAAGLQHFQAFEQLIARTGRTPRFDSWITTGYLAIANYYFRQGEYRQTLNYLTQARVHAPTDPYLDHQETLLRRYVR